MTLLFVVCCRIQPWRVLGTEISFQFLIYFYIYLTCFLWTTSAKSTTLHVESVCSKVTQCRSGSSSISYFLQSPRDCLRRKEWLWWLGFPAGNTWSRCLWQHFSIYTVENLIFNINCDSLLILLFINYLNIISFRCPLNTRNFLRFGTTYRSHLQRSIEGGTDSLSRNAGTELSLLVVVIMQKNAVLKYPEILRRLFRT
jgi:hypothetical protein